MGSRDGARSGVWRVRIYRSDVYVAVRSIMGFVKVSLHQDRNCLFKITSEHRREMASREVSTPMPDPFAHWTRLPTPDIGTATALRITMPTDYLRALGEIDQKEIHWLKPAPAGQAVTVAFVYTRQVARGYGIKNNPTVEYLGHSHLPNGETVVLLSKYSSFDSPTFFSTAMNKSVAPQFLTEDRELVGQDDLRGIFYGDAPKEGTFDLVDAAGFAIRRNEQLVQL